MHAELGGVPLQMLSPQPVLQMLVHRHAKTRSNADLLLAQRLACTPVFKNSLHVRQAPPLDELDPLEDEVVDPLDDDPLDEAVLVVVAELLEVLAVAPLVDATVVAVLEVSPPAPVVAPVC